MSKNSGLGCKDLLKHELEKDILAIFADHDRHKRRLAVCGCQDMIDKREAKYREEFDLIDELTEDETDTNEYRIKSEIAGVILKVDANDCKTCGAKECDIECKHSETGYKLSNRTALELAEEIYEIVKKNIIHIV